MDTPEFSQRFGILLEAYFKGCGETMFVSGVLIDSIVVIIIIVIIVIIIIVIIVIIVIVCRKSYRTNTMLFTIS